jgi:long-chain acyl-CoA synthetase
MVFLLFDLHTNAPALIDGNMVITHKELRRLEATLCAEVISDELVLLISKNSTGSILGYTSFVNNNNPILLIDEWSKAEVSNLLVEYEPAYIWCPNDYSLSSEDYIEHFCIHEYKLYKRYRQKVLVATSLAVLLPTSGSTGSKKFVKISKNNLVSNTESIISYLKLVAEDQSITTLPMSYTYGLSVINTHLTVGASIVITAAPILSKEFLSIYEESQVTNINGVPYSYDMFIRLGLLQKTIPTLRFLTQAGGPISIVKHKMLAEFCNLSNIDFFVMYGQTEATSRMAYLPPDKSLSKIGSIGIPIPGGKFHIDSQTNELIYSGDNVSLGYATCRADLMHPNSFNGVLHTGDTASVDSDGYYYITGRLNRYVKVTGKRISLDDIQSILENMYPGTGFAVVGSDDKIVIYTDDLDNSSYLSIINHISGRLSVNKRMVSVESVKLIPRNAAGKILFKNLLV